MLPKLAFLRYLLCGCISCTVEFIISFAASHLLPNFEIDLYFFELSNIIFAHFLGYFLSLPVAYTLNSIFSFKCPLSFKRLIKFYLTYIPNYLIQMVTVFVTVDILNFDKLPSLIISALLAAPITFIIMKIFTFSVNVGAKKPAAEKNLL